MTKLDITKLTYAADNLLETTENPRHRQILEVYRRHVLLEVTGQWEPIFAPDMMVEHPVYRVNTAMVNDDGKTLVLDGADAVQGFYKGLFANGAPVMTEENESLAVADWGFASESLFAHYVPGAALREMGEDIDDADATYLQRYYIVAFWHFDERARLRGEHLYEARTGSRELIKLAPEEVVTPEEALRKLTPLIRPLPKYEPQR